jgi:hypothetical protein
VKIAKQRHGERYTNQMARAQVYPDYPKCALALGPRPITTIGASALEAKEQSLIYPTQRVQSP